MAAGGLELAPVGAVGNGGAGECCNPAVLPTMRTAIQKVNSPQQHGFEKAYAFHQGIVLSPSDLSVGAHRLDSTTVFPPDTFNDHITFYIDAPGTGVYLQELLASRASSGGAALFNRSEGHHPVRPGKEAGK
jgi:hypothetical protein